MTTKQEYIPTIQEINERFPPRYYSASMNDKGSGIVGVLNWFSYVTFANALTVLCMGFYYQTPFYGTVTIITITAGLMLKAAAVMVVLLQDIYKKLNN